MSDAPRGSPVKGMILGVVVDLGGSLVASLALFFLWAIWLGVSGLDPEGIAQSMTEPDPLSTVSLVSYVLGGAFSWFGGYVCARVAGLYFFLALLTFGTVMLGGWMGRQHNTEQPQ